MWVSSFFGFYSTAFMHMVLVGGGVHTSGDYVFMHAGGHGDATYICVQS